MLRWTQRRPWASPARLRSSMVPLGRGGWRSCERRWRSPPGELREVRQSSVHRKISPLMPRTGSSKTSSSRSKEVDKAIIDDALSFLKAKQSNPGTICLISDDADFHEMLGKFKTQGWHVFAITAGSIMHDFADSAMWWDVFMSNAASFEKTGAAGDETSRVYFRIPNKQ
mmetsp:Transcript_93676/g.303283  ORF Transcript_93676/g.303283 Transcript_93676/m.303283 type:complete len:170 (+) Transcript_93676:1270-1779(+)